MHLKRQFVATVWMNETNKASKNGMFCFEVIKTKCLIDIYKIKISALRISWIYTAL